MNQFVARLNRWSQSAGIRVKIMGLAVGMVLLMGLTATVVAQQGIVRTTSAELERRGVSIAADVAARSVDMLLTHSVLGLHQLLRETLTNNEDVRYVVIYNAKGTVEAHTFGTALPRAMIASGFPEGSSSPFIRTLSTEEGLLNDITLPMLDGSAGVVRVGMSQERIQWEANLLGHWLMGIMLVVAALTLIGAYLLTTLLTRPLLGLADAARTVGHGDLTSRVPAGPPDEIGLCISAFNEMLDQLQGARQLKGELMSRIFSAQEDERRRIARELHDETSQTITSLIVGLRALEEAHPPVQERSLQLRQLASSTLEEIHTLILELRPRVLDELGLVPALRQYTGDFGHKHSLEVEFQLLGQETRLDPMVESCVYRVVQEALTNVARHAHASSVSVILEVRPQIVCAIIEDDGCGFRVEDDPGYRSLGIAGMRERAALLDGSLQIESSPNTGTAVFLKVPLKGEELA